MADAAPKSEGHSAASSRMTVTDIHVTTVPKTAGETLTFTIRNVESAFANGLRRVLLAEVPTLAIERVEVRANTSCFHDEMLVHRLGLVPLQSSLASSLRFTRDCPACSARGCDQCQVLATLRARCPRDANSLVVTSRDIVFENDAVRAMSGDGTDGVWLLTLGRGQEVDFRLMIQKGIAKIHAKYMAVGTVAMQYAMDIRLNGTGLAALDAERRGIWVSKCPTSVFELDPVTSLVAVRHPDRCIYCRECQTIEAPFDNLPAPLVAVRPLRSDDGRHTVTFKVESTGALPAVELLRQAVAILRAKLVTLDTAVVAWKQKSKDVLLGGGGTTDRIAPAMRAIGIAPTAYVVPNADFLPAVKDTEEDIGRIVAGGVGGAAP